MSAVVAIVALPVAAVVVRALLGSSLGDRLVAVPSGERWHDRPTPTFGGVGIFAGFAAGIWLAVAVGAVEASGELLGIVGGATILFVAGLVDDLRHLSPLVKLAAQFAAAAVAIASGLTAELVANDVLAAAIAFVWLVGITNAFNLLDNMDGLAATLAAIACAYFAIDAATVHENETVLVVALGLGCACLGFLPFNLRPGRRASLFMGDSGSQVLGFALASLGLAASWTVAGTTLATTLLPLLVLAIPILDTTLVTVVRLLEGRPVTQGGRDHTSHRLVYYGLSEGKAVALLAIVAGALGATAVAYNVLDNPRVTVVGVLVTMVVLVQFASFLTELEERARAGRETGDASLWHALVAQPRRIAEVVLDFALVCVSFLASYALLVDGLGASYQRAVFLGSLPIVLATRFLSFTALGVYRRVWRFVGARDLLAVGVGCAVSGAASLGLVWATRPLGEFPWQVFLLDAVLCTVFVGGSRVAARIALEAWGHRAGGARRRLLVVGAGRFGRALARELQETPGHRVVGFLDDNPGVRRRRIHGIIVLGSLDEIDQVLAATGPDEVLLTIPDAPEGRSDLVVEACARSGIPCSTARRQVELSAPAALETAK